MRQGGIGNERTSGVGRRRKRALVAAVVSVATAMLGGLASYTNSASAALTAVNGQRFVGVVNNALAASPILPTLPRGMVWVPDASVPAGHWWVTDGLSGLCRLDPAPAPVTNNGPFVLGGCGATAKSGGQVVAGAVPGDPNSRFLYVADDSSKSNKVVRYKITGVNTAGVTPSISATLSMTVTNLTQRGGGGSGVGRPSALALITNPAVLPVGSSQDLLVGYLKSGDIMRLSGANTTNSGTPPVAQIGTTSDGIGANSFAVVGNDLYVAEIGGLGGVTKIIDPFGAGGRPPCTAASICTAVSIGSSVGFPGGLATDGSQYLYAGDVRVGGGSNNIYRVDLTASPVVTETLSTTVPAYTAQNSSNVTTNFTTYVAPVGLGLRLDIGDLLVGDDPTFLAATPINNQGHFWRIPVPAAAPTITAVAPNSGTAAGGTSVTVTGTRFAVGVGTTTFTFGASAPVPGTCATPTSCTVTSPAGSGTVDVVATVGGQSSANSAPDRFTYTAPPLLPSVTGLDVTSGPATGGTTVTVSGTNLGAGTVAFVPIGGGAGLVAAGSCTASACTVTSPINGAGSYDVIVTTGAGVSAPVPADVFSYTPVVTSVAPNSGPAAGGTVVTVTGNGFTPTSTVNFGAVSGAATACATPTTCTSTAPGGAGTVNVSVTTGAQTGTLAAAFSYTVALGPSITSLSAASGSTAGGTVVTIAGTGLNAGGTPTVAVGTGAGSFVTCASSTSCRFDTPPGPAGVVNVVLTTAGGAVTNAAQFTYVQAAANFMGWGITAPKGGAVWIPGALGGHFWSSDHAQGFCRQDPLGGGQYALNYAVCGDDLVGSAGQGVYDPRPAGGNPNLHYVYVPDNAVKSVAVWRLTFDSTTETMVADPIDGVTMATAMAPLANLRTLKPNGMALGPLNATGAFCGLPGTGCSAAQNAAIGLYVTDLTEKNIREITAPNGDPRSQNVVIVAATGDGRGANGTAGFIGSNLYVSGNRATQFFDVGLCQGAGGFVCGMASVPSPAGVFVAGTATDPTNGFVYQSNSPGGAAAAILRYDATHDVYVPFADGAWTVPGSGIAVDVNGVVHCEPVVALGNAGNGCVVGSPAGNYVDGGVLPGPLGGNVVVATGPAGVGAVRPWDLATHPTLASNFSFAFGISVDPAGRLIITEDPSAGARSGRGTMWQVPPVG